MSAKHTPLPWGISHGFNLTTGAGSRADYVCGPNPDSIGIKLASPWQEGAWDDDPEANANAEFIVRACNSHYELYEALKDFVAAADRGHVSMEIDRAARDALANASGGKRERENAGKTGSENGANA